MVARIEQVLASGTKLQINRTMAGTGRPNRKPFEYQNKIQCIICKKFGHCVSKGQICHVAAQVQNFNDYVVEKGDEGVEVVKQNQVKFNAFN